MSQWINAPILDDKLSDECYDDEFCHIDIYIKSSDISILDDPYISIKFITNNKLFIQSCNSINENDVYHFKINKNNQVFKFKTRDKFIDVKIALWYSNKTYITYDNKTIGFAYIQRSDKTFTDEISFHKKYPIVSLNRININALL